MAYTYYIQINLITLIKSVINALKNAFIELPYVSCSSLCGTKEMEEEGSVQVESKVSLNEQFLIFQIFLRYFIITVNSSSIAFLQVICEFASTAMKQKESG